MLFSTFSPALATLATRRERPRLWWFPGRKRWCLGAALESSEWWVWLPQSPNKITVLPVKSWEFLPFITYITTTFKKTTWFFQRNKKKKNKLWSNMGVHIADLVYNIHERMVCVVVDISYIFTSPPRNSGFPKGVPQMIPNDPFQ